MTGLTQSTAESLQVQNYGIGGHYVPHWDHRNKEDTPFDGPGNRIATALFYVKLKLKLDLSQNSQPLKSFFVAIGC